PAVEKLEPAREAETAHLAEPIASNENATSIAPYVEPEEPWLTIDVDAHNPTSTNDVEGDNGSQLVASAPVEPEPDPEPVLIAPAAAVSSEIAGRLQSSDAGQRVAALVELAGSGSEDSFALISRAFDDPSVEVRNAAANALYSCAPDHAASFTHA